jgi:Tfp pilus assembly protein PilV
MSTFPIQCTNKDCNKVWDAARFATDPRVVKRCPTWCIRKENTQKAQTNRASSSSSVYSGSKLVFVESKIKYISLMRYTKMSK